MYPLEGLNEGSLGVSHQTEISFDSNPYILLVGSEEKRFLVHESVLQQSPVFRAMTERPFLEKELQVIKLPADDPDHIDCLLRFLYSGDFISPKELQYRRPSQNSEAISEDIARSLVEDTEADPSEVSDTMSVEPTHDANDPVGFAADLSSSNSANPPQEPRLSFV